MSYYPYYGGHPPPPPPYYFPPPPPVAAAPPAATAAAPSPAAAPPADPSLPTRGRSHSDRRARSHRTVFVGNLPRGTEESRLAE